MSLALTTPFPGTYYYEHADELGIKILTDRWDEFDAKHLVIETKHLSEEELKALLEEADSRCWAADGRTTPWLTPEIHDF